MSNTSIAAAGPASLLVGLYGGRNHIFGKLCSRSTARYCPSFIHAACSLEGARSVLAFIDLTRAAAEAPSSDKALVPGHLPLQLTAAQLRHGVQLFFWSVRLESTRQRIPQA
jgi:hypothetical protein